LPLRRFECLRHELGSPAVQLAAVIPNHAGPDSDIDFAKSSVPPWCFEGRSKEALRKIFDVVSSNRNCGP
jgi:hypothetical protein